MESTINLGDQRFKIGSRLVIEIHCRGAHERGIPNNRVRECGCSLCCNLVGKGIRLKCEATVLEAKWGSPLHLLQYPSQILAIVHWLESIVGMFNRDHRF
jgi:hypothetical protein